MSYTPTNWQTGDTITAEKLNKLENGVAGGGGVYVVNAVTDEETEIITLDKTFLEIETAFLAGKSVIVYYTAIEYVDVTPYEVYYKNLVIETYRYPDNSPYGCGVHVSTHGNNTDCYHADSINGYPYFDPND